MNELLVLGDLHKYINSLGPMEYTLAQKNLIIGYKPISFRGASSKFATLQGANNYRCLILHVDPGNPESMKGLTIQKEIQDILKFDISEMRNIPLKKHQVFIPFEVIDSKEKMKLLKAFIKEQYKIPFNYGA